MAIITWNRGQFVQLSPNFTSTEFTCQCLKCDQQQVESDLLDRLEAVRAEMGTGIQITSGFRCREHQAELSNDPNYETVSTTSHSTHELGHAADCRPHKLGVMAQFETVLAKHFKAIGIAETWCHVDLRADKVRRWRYT